MLVIAILVGPVALTASRPSAAERTGRLPRQLKLSLGAPRDNRHRALGSRQGDDRDASRGVESRARAAGESCRPVRPGIQLDDVDEALHTYAAVRPTWRFSRARTWRVSISTVGMHRSQKASDSPRHMGSAPEPVKEGLVARRAGGGLREDCASSTGSAAKAYRRLGEAVARSASGETSRRMNSS